MLDFNGLQVPSYAKSGNVGGIVYANGCLPYRFDGLDGRFYLGSECLGDSLVIRPFAHRWESGERWGRKSQSWLDIAFLSPDKVVSVISFKKQAAANIFSAITNIAAAGIELWSTQLLIVSGDALVRLSDDGGFFEDSYKDAEVCQLTFPNEAECLELKAFIDSGRFRWHLVGEV